jgi:hypothetical protein
MRYGEVHRTGRLGRRLREPRDYSKAKHIIYIEIATKIISALALVCLGTAGWFLQRETEGARRDNDYRARDAQRYLPTLRGLTELEFAIDHAQSQLGFRIGIGTDEDRARLDFHADEIRSAASAIFFDGDEPSIRLRRLPTSSPQQQSPGYVTLPITSAAAMCSRLMSIANVSYWPRVSFTARRPLGVLAALDASGKLKEVMYPDEPASRAFEKWLGVKEDQAIEFESGYVYSVLDDLRLDTNRIIREAMGAHPELGEKYAAIRAEVENRYRTTQITIGREMPLVPLNKK